MNNVQFVARFIATFGWIGYVPYAPGTAASVVATFLFYYLPTMSMYTTCLWGILLFIVATWSADCMARMLRAKDPLCIVIDEVLGMYLACMTLPKIWWVYGLAFLGFRFFDIVKPFPIDLCERVTYKNLGIILDDAVAGLVTLGILIVLRMGSCF